MMSQWTGRNGDVRAHINYFPSNIGKEIDATACPPPATAGSVLASGRKMTVTDIAGREDMFELDRNGFQFIKLPSKDRDMSTDAIIEQDFYAEIEAIIQARTDASFVFPIGHVLRRATNEIFLERKDSERYNRFGASFPHCDCPVAYPERLEEFKNLVMRSPAITKNRNALDVQEINRISSRWAIIQIWKPLRLVQRDPLAVCDALSYDFEDWRLRIVPAPSTGYSVLTHPEGQEKHRWYYASAMTPDQMILFKGCDSRQDITGRSGAHTAITLPNSEGKPPRESIEARFLCFWVEGGLKGQRLGHE
ncbi:hypothetical protein CBER1_11810 [Cercospora berteroae]|uniref:GA4 desaturase family protein n=1 Tax=Cercospora berteroae TaxID=357750 RepID=A0A2S6C0K4_9PEZI|nr:hypothetical protein CBER1_11810 [Cercospora berteroae]